MKHIHTHQRKSIGYVRSAIQTPEGEKALLEQISKIRATGVTTIVCEFSSGTASDREGLPIVLELARAKKINEIVVTRFDRIMRSMDAYLSLQEELKLANVKFRLVEACPMNIEQRKTRFWLQEMLHEVFYQAEIRSTTMMRQFPDFRSIDYGQAVTKEQAERDFVEEQMKRALTPEQEQIEEERDEKTTS